MTGQLPTTARERFRHQDVADDVFLLRGQHAASVTAVAAWFLPSPEGTSNRPALQSKNLTEKLPRTLVPTLKRFRTVWSSPLVRSAGPPLARFDVARAVERPTCSLAWRATGRFRKVTPAGYSSPVRYRAHQRGCQRLQSGLYPDSPAFAAHWALDRRFTAAMNETTRSRKIAAWKRAVRRTLGGAAATRGRQVPWRSVGQWKVTQKLLHG
jgi:hypothetical protein